MYQLRSVILLLLSARAFLAAATCGPTCGDWCGALGDPDQVSCFHPDPEGPVGCVDPYCCLTCDSYLRFYDEPNPSCSCQEFGGHCYASNCVPCAVECLPGFLQKEDGPLGTGLLCVQGAEGKDGGCEPCCQNSHDVGCKLECPCKNPAADCDKGKGSMLDFQFDVVVGVATKC